VPLLLALVLPLGLDTFAVATALGVVGVSPRRRLALGAIFAAFEGGMPLIGLLIGLELGDRIGGTAGYIAIAALALLGAYELFGDEEREEAIVGSLARAKGLVLVSAGLAVSLDELAIGFSFGLLNVPVVPAVVAIAVQAVIVSQLGFMLGSRIREEVREGAERIAGVVLIVVAVVLLVARLAGAA
jgi:putative Mn2+ efflux pump MntP